MTQEAAPQEPGADASPETESAAESPPAVKADDTPAEPERSKESEVQERINKLTKRYYDERRAAQAKDEEIAKLRRQLEDAPKEREPVKTLEDFDFDQGKYIAYLEDRNEKRATEAAKKVAEQFQKDAQGRENFARFLERERKFAETVDDYHEAVNPDRWPCSQVMAAEIHQSDVGPQMTYHLAKNPDVALEIAQLSDAQAVRRMVILEAEMKASRIKPKMVSEAPPPPPKIPAGDPAIEKDPSEMTDAEFAKWRRKQIAQRH